MQAAGVHLVQLGTLRLAVEGGVHHSTPGQEAGSSTGPGTLGLSVHWPALGPEVIDLFIKDYAHDDDVVSQLQTIKTLQADEGLGALFTWQKWGNELVVRVSLVPSDAPSSLWKRKGDTRKRVSAMSVLFRYLKRDWDFGSTGEEDQGFVLGLTAEDDLNMLDLYAAVPSPPTPTFPRTRWRADDDVKQRLAEFDNPLGVKSVLYQYQIRSVAKMLKMETEPDRLVDPTFLPLREAGREGTYYLNLASMDVQRHPGWYDLPKGGILCEQMGTGKTLMCLSLILATAHQPCLPPGDVLDISPTYTARAEGNYPFQAYSDLRDLSGLYVPPEQLVRPTLEDMCADILAKTDHSLKGSCRLPPTLTELVERHCFYYETPHLDDCIRAAKRKTLRAMVKKIWLATTTLIVVPAILVPQWRLEIDKHLEEGSLSIYEAGKEELPSIERLMTYDVILMDVLRFGMEWTATRRRMEMEDSVLLQARWKRIILDEGHVAGQKTSNAMNLARVLNVERRWIVSGTPTRHLQQGGETQIESMQLPRDDAKPKTRAWSRRDFEDASRIGVMVGYFLAAQPFKSEDSFSLHITSRLRGKQGPKFGAVGRMRYIMSKLMVKHGPLVIDNEAHLPPTTLGTHLVDFAPMQRVTYNVLTALIAANVYTSGAEDQDYFLHPKNVKSLNQVIDNLHLASFWYSASEMGVHESIRRSKKHIAEHKEKGDPMPEQARVGLEEAIHVMEQALDMPGWEEWMTNGVSIPFDVPLESLPYCVQTAWSDSMDGAPHLIDAHSLLLLRNLNTPGRKLDELNIAGWDARAHKSLMAEAFLKDMDRMEKMLEREGQVETPERIKGPVKDAVKDAAAHRPSLAPRYPARKSAEKKGRKINPDDPIDLSLEEAASNAYQSTDSANPIDDSRPRPLPSSIHTKSRSAKVNFVLSTILASEATDKFVIAGDKYELGILDEALELFEISVCYVGAAVSGAERLNALRRFEDPEIKVCLLDLSLAARGLNLVCANRMIFLAPVWSLDVQAQAIKRIHRIGQIRPTKVEILVTKGTFEEEIAQRSSKSRSSDEEIRYSRAMIENPRFVLSASDDGYAFQLPLTPVLASKPKAIKTGSAQRASTPESGLPSMAISPITPAESTLLTPTSAIPPFPSAFASSGSELVASRAILTSALKRPGGDEGIVSSKPKKKAKVVFED